MNNADLPAMPIAVTEHFAKSIGDLPLPIKEITGLTKREMFAMAAMQGLLVNAERNSLTFDTVQVQAVKCADALLAQLEITK